MGLHIVSTAKALPKKRVTNDDLSKIVDTSDEWIVTRTGIKSRYQCEAETALSLAVTAAKEALKKAGIEKAGIEKAEIEKEDIACVIAATSTAEDLFPSVASMTASALELPEELMAFDISAACTGFIFAMGLAESLLKSQKQAGNNKKKYALLIGTEELSSIIDYSDRGTCVLFGDGAGAAVVELTEAPFYQKSWSRGTKEALTCKRKNGYVSMKGNDVFRFAVTALEQAIKEVLADTGNTMDDIEAIFCHQANERIINHVAKKVSVSQEKMPMNISEYGNTSAASIPILLSDMMDQGRLKNGKKYICVGFGAGLTWSAIYFEQ